jgi:hypothetical protein
VTANNYVGKALPCRATRERFKLMLLAYVMVGDAVQGTARTHPPRKPRGLGRYETMVDNESNPKIIATTVDGQALPLYIVAYMSNR